MIAATHLCNLPLSPRFSKFCVTYVNKRVCRGKNIAIGFGFLTVRNRHPKGNSMSSNVAKDLGEVISEVRVMR